MVWNKEHHKDNDVKRGDLEENEVNLNVVVNTEVPDVVVYNRTRCVRLSETLLRSSTCASPRVHPC